KIAPAGLVIVTVPPCGPISWVTETGLTSADGSKLLGSLGSKPGGNNLLGSMVLGFGLFGSGVGKSSPGMLGMDCKKPTFNGLAASSGIVTVVVPISSAALRR